MTESHRPKKRAHFGQSHRLQQKWPFRLTFGVLLISLAANVLYDVLPPELTVTVRKWWLALAALPVLALGAVFVWRAYAAYREDVR